MLCDEVVDVTCKQQVSIVLTFVDSGRNIREEFLDFIKKGLQVKFWQGK